VNERKRRVNGDLCLLNNEMFGGWKGGKTGSHKEASTRMWALKQSYAAVHQVLPSAVAASQTRIVLVWVLWLDLSWWANNINLGGGGI
jgi:hypothetical protein